MASSQQRSRLEMKRSLPKDLDEEETQRLLQAFHSACALTGSTDHVTLDHFVPIEWGHGGTIPGNVYPLDYKLNKHKSNKNPFNWIKTLRRDRSLRKGKHIDDAWNRLLAYLAAENGLTVGQFKEFVSWCEQHKRTVEEVRQDHRMSLEIWKESRDDAQN